MNALVGLGAALVFKMALVYVLPKDAIVAVVPLLLIGEQLPVANVAWNLTCVILIVWIPGGFLGRWSFTGFHAMMLALAFVMVVVYFLTPSGRVSASFSLPSSRAGSWSRSTFSSLWIRKG